MISKKIMNNLLKKNKNTTESLDPPDVYEISPENTVVNKTQSELCEDIYYDIPDMNADISIISKKLTKNRKHYLNRLEKDAREDAIQRLTKKLKYQVKNSIEKSENIQEILDLIKKKHEWKSSFFLFDNSLPKICKAESCANFCISGSDFCLNHISRDPLNNLFIECSKCHRTHPKNVHCPI